MAAGHLAPACPVNSRGKFVINTVKTGVMFHLKASNGQIIADSQVYKKLESCKKGIASVQKNAPAAPIENQTAEGYKTEKNPKFEVYTDKAGEFRFRLKAVNGQIIATSEGYKKLDGCLNGISPSRKTALTQRS